ncbi:hypothetical protein [Amycolatopsis sp. cmx-4-54]|uniref:hypothetical protein n=1 Tax=Amycolatopsis sp. cmx-4-54 TaxID=2790936 RepID=UPI00397CF6FB
MTVQGWVSSQSRKVAGQLGVRAGQEPASGGDLAVGHARRVGVGNLDTPAGADESDRLRHDLPARPGDLGNRRFRRGRSDGRFDQFRGHGATGHELVCSTSSRPTSSHSATAAG